MRNVRAFALIAFALALSMGHTAKGQGSEAVDFDETIPTEESSSHDESKHLSCQQMCLADGEDPLDCESYCIQVAEGFRLKCDFIVVVR
jgi:hypothetical protein